MRKLKQVKKEPKFKSTDGVVTTFDEWLGVTKENWCVQCGRAIPASTVVCPYCGAKQKLL